LYLHTPIHPSATLRKKHQPTHGLIHSLLSSFSGEKHRSRIRCHAFLRKEKPVTYSFMFSLRNLRDRKNPHRTIPIQSGTTGHEFIHFLLSSLPEKNTVADLLSCFPTGRNTDRICSLLYRNVWNEMEIRGDSHERKTRAV